MVCSPRVTEWDVLCYEGTKERTHQRNADAHFPSFVASSNAVGRNVTSSQRRHERKWRKNSRGNIFPLPILHSDQLIIKAARHVEGRKEGRQSALSLSLSPS